MLKENKAEGSDRTAEGKELKCSFEEKLSSSARKTQHELWQNQDENEQLLEILWNQGPVARPVRNNEESSQQMRIEEDEMATWLHYYQAAVDESESGMVDMLSELVEPSCRDSGEENMADKEEDGIILEEVEMKILNEVTESVSERDSVGCSVHVNNSERKRKESAGKDIEYHCESKDVEVECGKKRKEVCQPAPLRTRAAEVHNKSERRRRDRINEKMKTLQELVPRCNKTDKASMLDDAIEYIKVLQLQVQMLSATQYNMGQMMMFPDTHRYMGYMGTGMPPGAMQQPMMPLGSMVPYPMMMAPPHGSIRSQLNSLLHQGVVASILDPRTEASNNKATSSSVIQMPNTTDPCHPYASFHYHQVPSQSAAMVRPPAEPRHMKTDDSIKRQA